MTESDKRRANFLARGKEADQNAAQSKDQSVRDKWERIARAYRDLALAPDKYIKFACPHCGQLGEVAWEGDGKDRELVRLSNGFHVEEGRLAGARHVIVCDACDEIDPLRTVKL